MDDTYLTIKKPSRAEMKVKGSRFIAETFLVESVDDAIRRLSEVRRREYQASHHCFAYVVGLPGELVFKYSDHGEPNGTAGRPIYDVIAGRAVTNVLCVITRYFGGTKLGTGGLARAYSEAALTVMDHSGMSTQFMCDEFQFTLDFSFYDRWQKDIHTLGAEIVDSTFADIVTMQVKIRTSKSEELLEIFTNTTAGRGRHERISSDRTD